MRLLLALSLTLSVTPENLRAAELPYYEILIKRGETLSELFGRNWETVARFNRIDEKHLIAGKKLKVPKDLEAVKNWTPMPEKYNPAEPHITYILIDLNKQFLGLYRKGKLIFDAQISSGKSEDRCDSETGICSTPTGLFYVSGGDKSHESSLYKNTEGNPYPMNWAIRFHIKNGIQYWIHRGELPGRPDSHGCVRLTEKDAKKLFNLLFKDYPEDEFWINTKKYPVFVEIK